MNEKSKTINISRMDFFNKIKQGAIFVVPTLVTFRISELYAQTSAPPGVPIW